MKVMAILAAIEHGYLVGAILLLLLGFALVAAELVVPSHGVLTIFAAGAAFARRTAAGAGGFGHPIRLR